jgi:hypothetical protein
MARIADKVLLVLLDGAARQQVLAGQGTWAEMDDEHLAARLVLYVLDFQQRKKPVRPAKKDYQSWTSERATIPPRTLSPIASAARVDGDGRRDAAGTKEGSVETAQPAVFGFSGTI